MKQQEVFRKTGAIIKELNEQYEYLQNTADNLNDLELELFVANTHFLKDHAEILRKLNLQKVQLEHALPPHVEEKKPEIQKPIIEETKKPVTEDLKPAAGEPKYFEPLVQQAKPVIERAPFNGGSTNPEQAEPVKPEAEPKAEEQSAPQIDLHTGTDKDSYSFEREEPETIRHELAIDEAADWDEEEEVSIVPEREEVKTPAPTTENISGNGTITHDETEAPNIVPTNPEPVIDNTPKTSADEPAKEEKVLTFNQRMSAQLKDQQGTNSQPVEVPIKDLKAAISLNDKLLFVKDLFNGYSLAYSEAIEIVNRFTSFEEADRFLKTNYVVKNNWEGKKATSDKFYALLKRRYA
jgi:hypothetical protein